MSENPNQIPNQEINPQDQEGVEEMNEINQDTNQEEELDMSKKELSEEELKQLVKKALAEGTAESKYFLQISLFRNDCHPDGLYKETYDVLLGEIRELEVNKIEDSCTKTEDLMIIPKTRRVVLIKYGGFENEPAELHVFDFKSGWRVLYL